MSNTTDLTRTSGISPPSTAATCLYPPELIAGFWARVDLSGGDDACWPWLSAAGGHGHGQFRISRNIRISVARFAYQTVIAQIEPGLLCIRECGRPPCCNPKHIQIGTSADAARNRIAMQRNNAPSGPAQSLRVLGLMKTSNKTGFVGVSLHKSNRRYQATICVDGQQRHLGYFDTPEEASAAYELRLGEVRTLLTLAIADGSAFDGTTRSTMTERA